MAQRLIRALLLERGTSIEAALKADVPYRTIDVRGGLPFGGRLAVMDKPARTPGWVEFVGEAVAEPLIGISNLSSGAALFVPTAGRVVVYTFGRGRNLIDPAAIEDGFGLRVTLNSVDPLRVRAVDSRSFEDLVIHQSRQASQNTELGAFAIDDSRDVLGAVAGVPLDATLGSRIYGADGVAISTELEVAELGHFARRLLELRNATAYQVTFGFIDHVRQVQNPGVIATLDAGLDQALAGTLAGISLAPPERVDYEDAAGYLYPAERRGERDPHHDISLADYLVAVGGTTTVERLRVDRIRLMSSSTEDVLRAWRAFNCVVYETRIGSQAFILSNGKWFEVAPDYVSDIEDRLRRVEVRKLGLPDGLLDETETAYNRRVAGELAGAHLLDIVPFKPQGARTPIELADLALGNRLVQIKRRTSSSTLSHLFAQGRTAAETLKADPAVRAELRARLASVGHPMADLLVGDRLRPGALEICFAIISDHPAELPAGLPFFSKLNLVRSREFLERSLDFGVSASFVYQSAH